MPFVRFSRDRRGYEHTYLVHTPNRRGGKPPRPRVLYWYRTPPGVKVGREPFDAEIRHALETQNPDVVFDWEAIVATPVPPPDTENWRERRRVERAAKQARAVETTGGEEGETTPAPQDTGAMAQERTEEQELPAVLAVTVTELPAEPSRHQESGAAGAAASGITEERTVIERRRPRRRRRGRGARGSPGSPGARGPEGSELANPANTEPSVPENPTGPENDEPGEPT